MKTLSMRLHLRRTLWKSDCKYSIRTIDAFLWAVQNDFAEYDCIHYKGRIGNRVEYLQAAAAFDIETTSTMIDGEKAAFMYVWQFGINGIIMMGRTWEEFRYFLYKLSSRFGLGDDRKMFVYVHNLSYEFQFMRFWLNWKDVFALESLTPLSAELDGLGIIFRCSYLLTGRKLENLAEKLDYFPEVVKKIGSLQYDLIHTQDTVLTESEIEYCIFDIIVVMCYIAQCADEENGIENIPRTKTGYVRRRCRNAVLYHKELQDENARKREMFKYRKLMNMLTLTPPEYMLCREAFAGGFTHANCYAVGEIWENVTSFDFSSSYPASLCMDYYPASRGRLETPKTETEYRKLCGVYCVIADVTFYGLKPKIDYEFYISKSKGRNYEYETYTDIRTGKEKKRIKGLFDNGRIVECARVSVAITEIDFDIIDKVYTWDKIEIGTCYTYTRGRLPSDLVRIIADMYAGKTTLKGVEGREKDYLLEKEDLNSVYGMMVTDVIRTIYSYSDDWNEPEKPNVVDKIAEYNKSFSRFTFYPHGIYCTAHCRRRLWCGILACGHDYLYADTDSIKIINAEKHMDFINRYNNAVMKDLEKTSAYHDIPMSKFTPKTKDGDIKPLGFWDFDGFYTRFKTLGAKRYLREIDGKLKMTMAGVNPKAGAKYMTEKYKNRAFECFADDLYIPAEHTGKLTHTYIDKEIQGEIVDYTGRTGRYYEKSFIHLSPADYTLSMAAEFVDFLKGVQDYFEI